MSPGTCARETQRRLAGVVLAAGIALLATGCGPGAPTGTIPPQGSSGPPTQLPTDDPAGWWEPANAVTTLASELLAPWSVVPLESGGALVSERGDGTIRELTPDGTMRVAGVVPGVVSGGEAGLHGLAVWEDRDGDRWLYAYHGAQADNRVVRMPLTGASGALAFGVPEVVVDGIARNVNHNGGRIAFGPDGFLYITTGDAGERADAQDRASLNGKILRVTPTGLPASGNPFDNEVWSLGHRNVQGIAWTTDGTMWASEFGQNTWDELNVIRSGENYGWPDVEGVGNDSRYVDPVAVWATDDASPSGIAAVGDTLFIAALRGERLWVVDTAGETLQGEPTAVLVGEQGRLRDAVAAPDGSLWILTNNTDGRGSARADDDVLLRVPLARHD